jgi:pimeloyl-ACP methyl ester carboxylesterase
MSHKVIRYDLRGFGKSAMPVVGESYRHQDDLKALLEFLDVPRAHICGLSLGSAIAADFVLTYPEMSISFIPVGPWLFEYDSPSVVAVNEFFGQIAAVAVESGPKAATDFWAEAPFFQHEAMQNEMFQQFADIGYDYSYWHFLNPDPMVLLDPLAVEQLEKINVPTLIVTSEYDLEPCIEIADLMEKKIANAQKIVVPQAGHGMNAEKPEEFNKAVLEFLGQVDK